MKTYEAAAQADIVIGIVDEYPLAAKLVGPKILEKCETLRTSFGVMRRREMLEAGKEVVLIAIVGLAALTAIRTASWWALSMFACYPAYLVLCSGNAVSNYCAIGEELKIVRQNLQSFFRVFNPETVLTVEDAQAVIDSMCDNIENGHKLGDPPSYCVLDWMEDEELHYDMFEYNLILRSRVRLLNDFKQDPYRGDLNPRFDAARARWYDKVARGEIFTDFVI